jgi:hypothetical protein
LFLHGMGSAGGGVFEHGREIARDLSQARSWRVIYGHRNDSAFEDRFELIVDGACVEGRGPELLAREGVVLPGLDPFHPKGLGLIGVTPDAVRRVDAIHWG